MKWHKPTWQGFIVGAFVGIVIAGCFGWLK
jgi:hypothetical protein